MAQRALHPSATRLASDLEANADPVKAFVIAGGRLSHSSGTNFARLFGVTASCTVSEGDAVRAWVRSVRRKAGAE